MKEYSESIDLLNWEIRDGKILITLNGKVLYEMQFDGTNLLYKKDNGFMLVFEKQY